MDEFILKFQEACGAWAFDGLELSEKTLLSQLPFWDSLAVVVVVAMMDSEYHQKVYAAEIARCKTIGDLYRIANEGHGKLGR